MQYQIQGGKKLVGKINISGNKNSIFPCIAAALLTEEEIFLENIPVNRDTGVLLEILSVVGVAYEQNGNNLRIQAQNLGTVLPKDLMVKLRGSLVLAGAILARKGEVAFFHPGGDVIGKRSIQSHLEGFKALGAQVNQDDLNYKVILTTPQAKNRKIFLSERSVTGTENLLLAASLREETVTLRNCACEPHVVDLCRMLTGMGVNIVGIGSETLVIIGKNKLNGTTFKIGADIVEVGTYAIAAGITKGQITMSRVGESDLDPIISVLEKFGINFSRSGNELTAQADSLNSIEKLITNAWPGFPTDLMSATIVLATQSSGVTLCHDWMYESRMFFVDKLIAMGANITIADPHRVLVYGPTKLRGRQLESPDIRAGIALVLAALVAEEESIIEKSELIERGYEDVVGKLQSLGANIQKVV